jgi:amino acid transporter
VINRLYQQVLATNKFTIMDASFITLYILTWFGAAYFIAALLGEKRTIGFWPSFAICVLLTPVVGFIVTYFSKRRPESNQEGTLV